MKEPMRSVVRSSTLLLVVIVSSITGLAYSVSSCASTPAGKRVQLVALSRELDLAADDLRDVARILEPKRLETAQILRDLADLVEQVHEGLDQRLAGAETPNLSEIISVALQTTEQLTDDPDVQAIAFVLRSALRRVSQYTDS